jgi:hypothetical protein
MKGPFASGSPWWVVLFAVSSLCCLVNWIAFGSAWSAFCLGGNAVFLMWAIGDHLDAKLARLKSEALR